MKTSPLSKLVSHRPVTLKRIAEHLGLSVTTVARSLKDGHKISAETVQRVRDTAEALGYVRNLDGLRLRTGQSLTLMAVLSDGGECGMLAGLHRRLAETHFSLRVVPARLGEGTLPAIRDAMRSRQADGIILDDLAPDDARVRMLLDHDFPFVTLGRTGMADRHAWFDLDDEGCAAQSTAALIAKGHRRIALIGASAQSGRLAGYRAALAAAGLDFDPSLVLPVAEDMRALRAAVVGLCRAHGPDAFVCADEPHLLATLAALREAGTRAVEDTGFALRSATDLPACLGIAVTASHFPADLVGWELADLLLRRMEGEPVATLQRLVCPALHEFG